MIGRRSFIKGMFGASLVTSIPKSVINEIDRLEKEKIPSLEIPSSNIPVTGKPNRFYLWRDDKLVAVSTDKVKFGVEPILKIETDPLDEPIEHIPSPFLYDWKMEVCLENYNREEIMKCFEEGFVLDCVLYSKEQRIALRSNVIIESMSFLGKESFPLNDLERKYFDKKISTVMLKGIGALNIEYDESLYI